MQTKLYKNQGPTDSTKLILFFNGWAMTPEAIDHMVLPDGYDLLVFWDYRTESYDFEDWHLYQSFYLVAWSMGVWAADRFFSKEQHRNIKNHLAKKGIAVCGTGYPMDDLYGIPNEIFMGTLNSITEANRKKFNRRMCGGKSLKKLFEALEKRSTNEVRDELENVQLSDSNPENHPVPKIGAYDLWGTAWIGEDDRIVPPNNQIAYWHQMGVDIVIMEKVAHYPFLGLESWEDVLG